ncbi:MAG: oxidoreductase, partial [Natronosporangium sp.]
MAQRTALITGAAGGLGGAVVETFLADGWRVVAPELPDAVDRLARLAGGPEAGPAERSGAVPAEGSEAGP